MERALIIGGSGFVGEHLARRLTGEGYDTTATKLPHEPGRGQAARYADLDVLDADALAALLRAGQYNAVCHLAAQSSVALSWQNPALTVDINIKGCCNLLQAVKELDHRPRVLLVGSGEEYGVASADGTPVGEDAAPRPGNVYAATKACQNMLGKVYADAYGLDIVMVRAFNHIGPGQAPHFAVADFCRQIAQIEAGQREPLLSAGNLSARRDFTDVRDVAGAYVRILQQGIRGETYNVGSGRAISIGEVLGHLLALAKCPIRVQTEEAKLRPADSPAITADTGKLARLTGWSPQIPLRQSLQDCLEYARAQITPPEGAL